MSRNIVRVNKTKNYTVMSNTHLRDINLSWKAKGIHSYVLSLPDDWKIILTHLKTMATDGEKSMRSGLQELYDLHYWQRYPIYVNGRVDKWVTEIYEEPFNPNEKIKNIIIKNNVETIYYENETKQIEDVELLPQKVKVGTVEEGNINIGKDKLLSTKDTKDLSISNNSFNQSNENERMNEYNQIISNIDLESFTEYQGAIEQAIRILYYTDKPLYLNNINTPPAMIRNDLKRLQWKHIDLALRDFKIASERERIDNVAAYLSRCIYNSIFNADLKLDAEINYNGNLW